MARFKLPHQDRIKLRDVIRQQQVQSVIHQKLDTYLLDQVIDESKRFKAVVDDKPEIGEAEYEPMPNLTKDVFYAQINTENDVHVREQRELMPAQRFHSEVMHHYVNHPDFAEAHSKTRGDEVASAVATMAAHQAMIEEIRKVKERGDEETEQQDQWQQLQQAIDDAREKAKQNGGSLSDEEKEQMKQNIKARNQLENQMGMPDHGDGAASAAAAGAQEAKDTSDAMSKLPGFGSNEIDMTVEEALDAVQTIRQNPELRLMLDFFGRLERDFRYARSKRVIEGKEEIIGVTVGADPDLLLPDEFSLLSHPITRLEFFRRFVDEQLLQFETRGEEQAGKGPLVILRDSSGSMGSSVKMPDGEEMSAYAWASAVTVALATLANREKREVVIIDFDGAPHRVIRLTKNDRPDLKWMQEVARWTSQGGTSINAALGKACEITKAEPDFRQADVVLITDGEDYWTTEENPGYHRNIRNSEDVCRDLHEQGVRIHGIAINMGEEPEFLSKAADATDGSACLVSDMTSADDIRHVAVGLA